MTSTSHKTPLRHRRPLCWASALFTALTLAACQSPPPVTPPSVPAPVSYSGPTLAVAQSPRGVQIFLPGSALFETGQARLNPTESGPYLSRVADLLLHKTDRPVVLEGHTDNTGSDATNQTLSEARAQTVRQELIALGVPAARLKTEAYSYKRPVASNATEEGRRLNRRVEVLVLDEQLDVLTRGEAPNAFESAWDRLKSMIDQGLVRPAAAS